MGVVLAFLGVLLIARQWSTSGEDDERAHDPACEAHIFLVELDAPSAHFGPGQVWLADIAA